MQRTSAFEVATSSTGAAQQELNVGYFPSIPWIPYFASRSTWPAKLQVCESSGVRNLAHSKQLDVTPMAIADWFAMSEQWHRLSSWGIAFRRRAGSVLLFSPKRPEDLDLADIDICGETTTSVRLLEAILKKKYGLRIGRWRRNPEPTDLTRPRLLIQNQAVEEKARGRFEYVIDLGQEWWEWQSTPVVTALWVHRRDLDSASVSRMNKLLRGSMDTYFLDSAGAIRAHKTEYNWSPSVLEIQALHGNFEYALGEECERGIQRMRAILPVNVEGFANALASDGQDVNVPPQRLLMA